MKNPIQSMQKELDNSRNRTLDLKRKMAQLPSDSSAEVLALYENQLAKEKKFQTRMAAALTPVPGPKKAPKYWITIAALSVFYLVYRISLD